MAAVEAKNKGNAAFTKGAYDEAIQHFTEAIGLDPSNHILYSNRSAAYSSLKKWQEALTDADKTIELNPKFAKAYSRKGAALHGMNRLDEAIETYEKGLEIEPNNDALKTALAEAEGAFQAQATRGGGDPMAMFNNMFSGDIFTKLRMNPQTAKFLDQPDYIAMMTDLQKNPKNLQKYMQDKRVMASMGVLMGVPMGFGEDDEEMPDIKTMPTRNAEESTPAKEAPKEEKTEPEPMKIEQTEAQKTAEAAKEKGNEAYKKKDFDNAIKFYNEAIAADATNCMYLNNRAAVYLEQNKIEEAIADCTKAIEVGTENRADYQNIAKVWARLGNAHTKAKQYEEAIKAYNKSLLEHRTAPTLALLKKVEKMKEDDERNAYLSPEKSLEAKNRGNEFFRNGKYPESIQEYTEAIKRNPTDPALYSNRAASYTKLQEFPLGIKDCDEAIKLDPKFVKAYTRKGHIQFFMKEYRKALETYDEGLKIDPNNQELTQSIERTISAMNQPKGGSQGGAPDKETLERAMADPEVQQILGDPVMRQILDDMQNDPKAAANHMKNPMIMGKVQKLVDAGILRIS